MANAFYFIVGDIFVLFALMVLVGLMGGAAFVNILYQIKTSD